MSNTNYTVRRAVLVWLSGLAFADIQANVGIEELAQAGIVVELEATPIVARETLRYQALTGRQSAFSGFFDTFVPRNYKAEGEDYGRGVAPRTFPEILRQVGWQVREVQVTFAELSECLHQWEREESGDAVCLLVKVDAQAALSETDRVQLSEAVSVARSIVGQQGLLALFSEAHAAQVKRFVNINNFLADMGIIERDEQTGWVKWSDSLAYHLGHGQLWVNLLGRDGQGAVHPQEEYEEVCESLVKALPVKLRDPETGEAVIERVYRKEELYSGDYLFCAPDLVVVFKPGYTSSAASVQLNFDESSFTTPGSEVTWIEGMHSTAISGFLLAVAPTLQEGSRPGEPAPLTGVAATLLHALGIEYGEVDTAAIEELFVPAYLEERPIRAAGQSQELSEEDEELIISHLRDLGYV